MSEFSQRVVKIAQKIPAGKVATYGAIARAAGGGGQAARSVTAILGRAYAAGEKNIPFHRIVYAGGRIWPSSRHHAQRLRLYKKEGIRVDAKGRIENFREVEMKFT